MKLVPKSAAVPKYRDAAEVSATLSPQEPLFCFSAPQLAARARQFIGHFPGEVSYAVKCNPEAAVLKTLSDAGIKIWDVASVHEMAAVRAVTPAAKFHYHNPVKSRAEIKAAFEKYGCRRFAVDCRAELAKVVEIVGDARVEIAVRFVLPRDRASSAHDFSTKFGAPEHVAVELLKTAAARGYAPVLTFHPGSQSRDPNVYARHIEAAARIANAAGVKIAKLNVGGGFPANYLLSKAPDPADFFKTIIEAVKRAFAPGEAPALECEPGRGLAAPSMSLLTRVKLVCSEGDDIFINDGVYGGLMEFMQVPELMPPYRVIRDGKVLEGKTKSFKVFGPTCDPLDVLPHRLDLPEDLRDEDFIEFGMLGAYGLATTTRFNGYGNHAVIHVEQTLTL
ncbi:MAG: type III PLP-dependent enzyme [Rhizobiales bacterium]|nr:type III PLP-dependent enzyme [Hyphomicrobiales bacterium]